MLKIEMIFNTLKKAKKIYKDYSKFVSFLSKIKNSNRKENNIKNRFIAYLKDKSLSWIKISCKNLHANSEAQSCLSYFKSCFDLFIFMLS
ncbi:hypothetical protein AHAS_Ahas10G0082200 [Arachis hypogaea]